MAPGRWQFWQARCSIGADIFSERHALRRRGRTDGADNDTSVNSARFISILQEQPNASNSPE